MYFNTYTFLCKCNGYLQPKHDLQMNNLAILIGQVMMTFQWVSTTWHEPWLYTITSDVTSQIVGDT